MKIIYQTAFGVAVVTPSGELPIDEVALKDVPDGTPYEIVDDSVLPTDRIFRNAWEMQGAAVVESLPKSKLICHDVRRLKRAAEFAPLDVEATIPAKAATAEAARQVIRDKYATIQTSIDAAVDTGALRVILASFQ